MWFVAQRRLNFVPYLIISLSLSHLKLLLLSENFQTAMEGSECWFKPTTWTRNRNLTLPEPQIINRILASELVTMAAQLTDLLVSTAEVSNLLKTCFSFWDTSEIHWEIPLKKLTPKTPSTVDRGKDWKVLMKIKIKHIGIFVDNKCLHTLKQRAKHISKRETSYFLQGLVSCQLD